MTERMTPTKRRAEREAEHKRLSRNMKRRQAYYLKFVAGRPARCNDCGETKTADEMFHYARREISVKNQCHPCSDKEFETDYGYEPEYTGDRIYWKTHP
jgi:hypothetical protein